MSKKVVLFVGIGCGGMLLMFAACAGVLFWGWRSASTAGGEISIAVDEVLNAAAEGDIAKTYSTATTPEFRQVTSEAQYADLGKTIEAHLGPLQSKNLATINLRQLNAVSQADVIYQATFARGRATIHATLRRGEGRWLLQSLIREALGGLQHDLHIVFLGCGNRDTIELQEHNRGDRADAFITIEKRVISRDMKQICGGHFKKIGV